MSYFAEIDENNIVLRVLVGDNDSPNEGHDWFVKNLGGTWIQTNYNGNIRKNFASVGYSFDPKRDAFISPKPYESWLLDEETCTWTAPTHHPTDGKNYRWDQPTISWIEVIPEETTGV
jgi:hypothetical protein